jgi:hypothetical protein
MARVAGYPQLAIGKLRVDPLGHLDHVARSKILLLIPAIDYFVQALMNSLADDVR